MIVLRSNTLVNFNANISASQRSPRLFSARFFHFLRKNASNEPNFIEIGESFSEKLPSFCPVTDFLTSIVVNALTLNILIRG